jgi:hypothetical protein
LQHAQLVLVEVLHVHQAVARALQRGHDLVELELHGQGFLVLGPLDEKTIRKVTTVVPVLTRAATCSSNGRPAQREPQQDQAQGDEEGGGGAREAADGMGEALEAPAEADRGSSARFNSWPCGPTPS